MPNLQNRIAHQRAGRLFCFWARPMHQGGRNGATKPLFVRERARLLVLFPRSVTFRTKELGKFGENAQSTKPNYASTCRAIFLFLGSANAPRRAQRSHQATFRARKGALTSVVSKVRNFSNKRIGEIWRKCPIYKTELRINVPGDYFVSGLGQCTKAGATEPPSHFSCEKGRAY